MADPERVRIDLLNAARRGDLNALARLFAEEDHLAISVPESVGAGHGVAARPLDMVDRRLLFGVTIGESTALHVAAYLGHADFVREILHREGSLLIATNSRGDTALHFAARAGHHRVVSQMLQVAAVSDIAGLVRARNQDGENALHDAARGGHVEVAQQLVEADNGLASITNDAGESPLYLAVTTRSDGVVRALLQSSSRETASYAGPDSRTALHVAVSYSTGISKLLLQWKSELVREVDASRRAPLHYAALSGNFKMVHLLLTHDTSTAYLHDENGFTPIHVAAYMGHIPVIKALLEHCLDADELLDAQGRTFLHIAAEANRYNMVRYVLKRWDLGKLINYRDIKGNTSLHLAVEKEHRTVVCHLVADKRVHLSIKNKEGSTPLDLSLDKVNHGPMNLLNEQASITKCLVTCGALFTRPIRYEAEDFDTDFETKKISSLSKTGIIAAVLIATVTFAAGFTVPGQFGDDGMAVLGWKYTFKVFLISDALAFFHSLGAAVHFGCAGSLAVGCRYRTHQLLSAMEYLQVAAVFMSIAFGMGVLTALPQRSVGIGAIICFLSFFSVFYGVVNNWWPIFQYTVAVVSRMGVGVLFNGDMLIGFSCGRDSRRDGTAIPWSVVWLLFWGLVLFLFIFLLSIV